MAVQILSNQDTWRDVAFTKDGDGYVLKPEAYAYVVIGAMLVGMPDLTEDTAQEWLTRLTAWELVDGPLCVTVDPADDNKAVGVPVTMDALRPFFGTRTNVFPKQTSAAFRKRLGEAVFERAQRKTAQ